MPRFRLVPLLLVPLFAPACGPDATAWPAPAPLLVLDGADLAFPDTPLGGRATLTLEARNDGTGSGAWRLAAPAPFEVSPVTLTLGAGASATVEVSFAPQVHAAASGTLATSEPGVALALTGRATPDADGDGHDALGAAGDDCDDADPAVHPGADDPCGDGVDSDCDPAADDCDGDGVPATLDCDDADADIRPGADETVDGVDQDCDGRTDEAGYAAGDLVIAEIAPQAPSWVEVCNVSDGARDLAGLALATFAGQIVLEGDPATVEPGSCVAVCASVIAQCGFTADLVVDGAADDLVLSVEGTVLDAVRIDDAWDWQPGWVWSLDAARVAADANNAPSAWCRTTGSPGEPNGACP